MKLRVLAIVVLLAVFAQGVVFARSIAEEKTVVDNYDTLAEQVDACFEFFCFSPS